MDTGNKPKSRVFWIIILLLIFLAGGVLLDRYVLPDLLKAIKVTAPTPVVTATPTTEPSASPIQSAQPEATPTPAPTPVDPKFSMSEPVAMAKQSVVTVIATFGKSETLHSGFVYTNGYIVTTYDGFEDAAKYAVVFDGDMRRVEAEVVQYDAMENLLVLTTERDDFMPVTIASGYSVKEGDYVFAVGTPLSIRYQNLVNRGIIAGVRRTLEGDETEYMIADVPTNPGHTGGVLFNNRGEMIGMLTDIRADAGFDSKGDPIAALGMTFVRPVDSIIPILNTLVKGKSIQRATLDMVVVNLTSRQLSALKIPNGIRVSLVKTGGAAQLAGIKNGDVILSFNGVDVTDTEMFNALVGSLHVGDTVVLIRLKNGEGQKVKVVVGNLTQ
jgi:serine protease Do